jgi:hypothetical protein
LELVTTLPALHGIEGATPVKLRATFAEAEHRRVSHREGNRWTVLIDSNALDRRTLGGPNRNRERIKAEPNPQIPTFDDRNLGITNSG